MTCCATMVISPFLQNRNVPLIREFGLYSGRQNWNGPPLFRDCLRADKPSRYAAPRRKTGAPLTAAGRSEPVPLIEGKGKEWERQPAAFGRCIVAMRKSQDARS